MRNEVIKVYSQCNNSRTKTSHPKGAEKSLAKDRNVR